MDIKDYLHLYLGCDGTLITKRTYGSPRRTEAALNTEILDRLYKLPTLNSFTPILRPLSDMTPEEFWDIFKPVQPEDITYEQMSEAINDLKSDGFSRLDFGGMDAMAVFEIFRKLLSKHFDLFDLIEAGLAIDKTQLK